MDFQVAKILNKDKATAFNTLFTMQKNAGNLVESLNCVAKVLEVSWKLPKHRAEWWEHLLDETVEKNTISTYKRARAIIDILEQIIASGAIYATIWQTDCEISGHLESIERMLEITKELDKTFNQDYKSDDFDARDLIREWKNAAFLRVGAKGKAENKVIREIKSIVSRDAIRDVNSGASGDAVQDATQDAAQDATQDAAQDAAQDVAQDVAQGTAHSTAHNTARSIVVNKEFVDAHIELLNEYSVVKFAIKRVEAQLCTLFNCESIMQWTQQDFNRYSQMYKTAQRVKADYRFLKSIETFETHEVSDSSCYSLSDSMVSKLSVEYENYIFVNKEVFERCLALYAQYDNCEETLQQIVGIDFDHIRDVFANTKCHKVERERDDWFFYVQEKIDEWMKELDSLETI